jgi:hypothetical protein
MSVNDLARYMVSSDTARIGIVSRAKTPSPPPIIRYKDARGPICEFLADAGRRVNPLVEAERMFQQRAEDPSLSALKQDDAIQSIEVLHAIQRMANRLANFDFERAPHSQSKLHINGVEISVRADLLVMGRGRNEGKIGAAVLRMTQDDGQNEGAISRRRDMGLYVATLARMHLEQNINTNLEISNQLCMSIDVQHGEAFIAPNANARRISNLESACRMIAAIWDSV